MERRLSGCNNNLRMNNRCGSATKLIKRQKCYRARLAPFDVRNHTRRAGSASAIAKLVNTPARGSSKSMGDQYPRSGYCFAERKNGDSVWRHAYPIRWNISNGRGFHSTQICTPTYSRTWKPTGMPRNGRRSAAALVARPESAREAL